MRKAGIRVNDSRPRCRKNLIFGGWRVPYASLPLKYTGFFGESESGGPKMAAIPPHWRNRRNTLMGISRVEGLARAA